MFKGGATSVAATMIMSVAVFALCSVYTNLYIFQHSTWWIIFV